MSRMYRVFCIAALLVCTLFAMASQAQSYPIFKGSTVIDEADLLSPEVEQHIHQKIMAHEDRTGQEMAVVTVNSLEGRDVETYATGLFRHLGIGDTKLNNGVLLLVAPNEREMRIEVGYGNEAIFTDLDASIVIIEVMTPRFKVNDMSGGIEQGVDAILKGITPPTAEEIAFSKKKAKEEAIKRADMMSDILIVVGLVSVFGVIAYFLYTQTRGLRPVGNYGDLMNTREESKRKAKELTETLTKDRERLHAEEVSRKAKAIVENDRARAKAKPARTRRVHPTASSPRASSSYSTRRSDDDDYTRTSIYTSTTDWGSSSSSSSSDWGSSSSSSDFGGGSSGGGGDSGSW